LDALFHLLHKTERQIGVKAQFRIAGELDVIGLKSVVVRCSENVAQREPDNIIEQYDEVLVAFLGQHHKAGQHRGRQLNEAVTWLMLAFAGCKSHQEIH